jgi:hypothetical protein
LETGLGSSNLHNHFLFTLKEIASHIKYYNSKDRCDKERRDNKEKQGGGGGIMERPFWHARPSLPLHQPSTVHPPVSTPIQYSQTETQKEAVSKVMHTSPLGT